MGAAGLRGRARLTFEIVVESIPFGMTTAEFFEAGVESAEENLTGLRVFGQTNVLVEGREAIIEDGEFDLSSLSPGAEGKHRTVTLTTLPLRPTRQARSPRARPRDRPSNSGVPPKPMVAELRAARGASGAIVEDLWYYLMPRSSQIRS